MAQQADIIRLLLLAGCHKSEIVTLRWQDANGTSSIWATPSRDLGGCSSTRYGARPHRTGNTCIFSAPSKPGRLLSGNLRLWRSLRREADIENARLHDLRHGFAIRAAINRKDLFDLLRDSY